jgi:phosphoribosyl 1,2-cyclic phosphate phosphodiesterase
MGVPTIGCRCAVCTSADPQDRRTRPSILVEYNGRWVLIDSSPDFREQAIREGIRRIDAVLYTHSHADHILGLDDLRPLTFHQDGKIPLYAQPAAMERIRTMFSYIFAGDYKYGGIAQVELHTFCGTIELFGAKFTPIAVMHGETEICGFRFGSCAYLTDHSEIPEASLEQLHGLDILFLDALRHKPHPTHSTVENSLAIVDCLKPSRAFFTHISHDLPHADTNADLPPHVRLAHDGLRLEFEI